MRSSLTAVLLFACLVIPASVAAQASPSASAAPVTSDPQAVALVQRALAAVVGSGAVSDATLTGTVQRIAGSDDESGTATLTAMSIGDSKLNLSFQSGPSSEIRNSAGTPLPGTPSADIPPGSSQTAQPVGAWSGSDSVLHPTAEHNLMTDPTWFFPSFTLANIASNQGYVVSYIGQETHDGVPALHVSASQPFPTAPSQLAPLLQHLTQMDLYLDPSTSLPIALTFNIHPDNNAALDISIEIRFLGYQSVNGVQVPFHVQKYLNGGLVLDFQFSNVVLNSGLTAASFELQ
jgi:hypothetical protein